MALSVEKLRKKLGLSQYQLAHALNVNARTVVRWEEGSEPKGLSASILYGIQNALEKGADPKQVGQRLSLGVGALLYYGLMEETKL
jgi:transcriptional regulator with XRE-family HTH domain